MAQKALDDMMGNHHNEYITNGEITPSHLDETSNDEKDNEGSYHNSLESSIEADNLLKPDYIGDTIRVQSLKTIFGLASVYTQDLGFSPIL